MSRRGDCWDNAVDESFFGTLKTEFVDQTNSATREAATVADAEYIEDFYNPRRRHSSLGYVSPLVVQLQHATEVLAAWSQCPRIGASPVGIHWGI